MREKNLKQIDILNKSLPYQKELGIKMGKSALSQYVSGKSNPDQQKLVLLSKSLGVSEPWLMGDDVPKERIPDSDRNSISTTTLTQVTDTTAKLDEPRKILVLNVATK